MTADQFMPSATITDFDETRKYNPTAGTYAAIYFAPTSPDDARTCCETRWSVVRRVAA